MLCEFKAAQALAAQLRRRALRLVDGVVVVVVDCAESVLLILFR